MSGHAIVQTKIWVMGRLEPPADRKLQSLLLVFKCLCQCLLVEGYHVSYWNEVLIWGKNSNGCRYKELQGLKTI